MVGSDADLQFGPLSYEGVMTEAYGQRLGEAMRVENAPAIVTRALRTADIAVTEIRCENPLPQMSDPIKQEDAFLIGLHLRDRPKWEYWEDSRRASVWAAKPLLAAESLDTRVSLMWAMYA